jgi:hypothetical protein
VGPNSERVLRQFAVRGSKRCDRLARRAIFVSLACAHSQFRSLVARAELQIATPNGVTSDIDCPRVNCLSMKNLRTKSFLLSGRFFSREQALSARLCTLAEATIGLLAHRISRREYAVVDRASLSNQTNPLELGFWNKPDDVA